MHRCMSIKAAGGTSVITLGVLFHYRLDLITVMV